MASDYARIRAENERRYGTDIGRIGGMLFADRYADRTHFIFELLQNAEDALARRRSTGPRAVTFALSRAALRVSHFGTPFNEADVRGICGIDESTKDITSIGRFGIGFKSVYSFTDWPMVHSGDDHFAIDSYVLPRDVTPIATMQGETTFILPFRPNDASALQEISESLRLLNPRTLLFLREVEEIAWDVEGGSSGLFLRGKPERISESARKVVLMGEEHGASAVEETWLIFSREASTLDGVKRGHVEIAFRIAETDSQSVQRIDGSPLVVFFPTIVETHLGFLVQGPYRTTPSRDNVPLNDPWNQCLVRVTATLLVEALCVLRDMGMLDVETLRCLPLSQNRFAQGRFAPLFAAVRKALASEPLLPCFGGGYVRATAARLARTQELRDLFSPTLLTALLRSEQAISWLSEGITQDRAPDLRQYLMGELNVAEITPESLLPMLTKSFLEAQSDDWILRLYEFLNRQPALVRPGRVDGIPLVRLEDGSHVKAKVDEQLQAYLPGRVATGFPTVRRAVCGTEGARALLKAVGLIEPDIVEDVIRNVLPKYSRRQSTESDELDDLSNEDYEADIARILNAYRTNLSSQREKLLKALRGSPFVRATDAGYDETGFFKPDEVYLPSQELDAMFDGVPDILVVDASRFPTLRDEALLKLLEECGALRYLQPIEDSRSAEWHIYDGYFTLEQLSEMRRKVEHEHTTGRTDRIADWRLAGLDPLLTALPRLQPDDARSRAQLLWKSLCDLNEGKGRVWSAMYTWTDNGRWRATCDAAFVRQLNERAWVPDADSNLQRPEAVAFDDLGWQHNSFLLDRIRFKPSSTHALALEAGFEPDLIDLLKKRGYTSRSALPPAVLELLQEGSSIQTHDPDRPEGNNAAEKPTVGTGGETRASVPSNAGTGGAAGGRADTYAEGPRDGGRGAPSSTTVRGSFISYVAVHQSDEEEVDPDGLERGSRLELEEKAIELILARWPQLQRTSTNNPGFDLTEPGPGGHPVRWVEVKAMTLGLSNRPATLSRRQFECALEHGEAYWLFVVEYADTPDGARIVRIKDPAGRAGTFTFDHGWLGVAETDDSPALGHREQTNNE